MATSSAKGQAWLVFVVAIACLGIGFAAASLSYRLGLLRVPHEPFIERMQRQLNLTPAQYDQILKIVQDTRDKVSNLRQDFQRQRRDALRQARDQVRALLTPEQQQKFDREFRPPHERLGPHPERGAPPPPP
jgi:Spy/CpxP family protein refolding chaperone